MKSLSANKMVALAACAAASTTSLTTAKAALSTSATTSTSTTATAVNRISRGGSSRNPDDDGYNNHNSNGNGNSDKPKKSSSTKKKKSTKAKREEKASSSSTTRSNSSNKGKDKTDAASEKSNSTDNPLLEEILGHDDLYDILGVPNTASEREIQKAYRKRCVPTHPDKTGGDRRAFDKVAEAYEVLSEPSKRQIYNRYGKEGLDPGSAASRGAAFGGGATGEMFRNMFQQAQQQRQQQQRRNQTLRYQLSVTLEDLYCGRTQSVTVTPPYNSRQRQQHNQSQRQRRKEVEVHVLKGMISGQSIVMPGEVDFNDNSGPPGDLVFILTQAPHATFTRKGHDLAMELTISLEEALCGMRRSIVHLDGSELWIESATATTKTKTKTTQSDQGSSSTTAITDDEDRSHGSSIPATIPITIQTGDVQVLKGKGMPKRNRNGEFGDLYIQYRVEMPQNSNSAHANANTDTDNALTNEEYKELARLLSKLDDNNGSRDTNASRRTKSQNRRMHKTEERGEREQLPPPKIYSLQQAKPSEFGIASGKVELEEDDGGFHEDHGEEHHPFASSFFGGQGFGGGGARGFSQQSFHFGAGNPFGGGYGGNPGDDDGNVQCQQM